MSIRAYKVKEIKQEKYPTFNVSQEFDWIMKYASHDYYNNCGELYMVEFEKELIEEGIEHTIDKDKLEILQGILKDFPKGEDYIDYICY